jgi:hypothetical protein
MTEAEPTAVRLPVEARASITQLIAELQIAADAAVMGLEATAQLLNKPGELLSITSHINAIGDGVAQLSGRWNALLALADAPKGGAA